jgi:hypothetical protein
MTAIKRPVTATVRPDQNSLVQPIQIKKDEEEEQYVIIASPTNPVDSLVVDGKQASNLLSTNANAATSTTTKDNQVHGKLVKTILETNKQMVAEKKTANVIEELNTDKDGDVLKDYVQQLSRILAPLVSLLDFHEEDYENMDKEYEFWKSEELKYKSQLDAEQS